ncbi:phage tail assembly protein [Moraxella nasibovis]|uniref:phage tail assembly protein n=1 Tax=Moraxella nasibovis TaxID=2904120 RepID=UPI002410550E|nr:phage tail assembly protein [Moraxella nasibovis]WFF38025.1 phage tail assembly protein [Moraxella nasibovis]
MTSKQITLTHGVKLGENTITEITIAKPFVSHLKGISLTKLFNFDTEELLKLIPRVTTPSLPQPALERMEISEFMELVGEVLGFLADENTATPSE